MIKMRLLGLTSIDLEDTDFLQWRGVRLSKLLTMEKAVDLVIGIDGLRPIIEGEIGSETLGISDVSIANRSFSFTTDRFDNNNNTDMWLETELNKWLLCPYKFFTLWHLIEDDNLYKLSHDSELGIVIINPPISVIGDIDTLIPVNEVGCIPVKVQSMGSVEHTFGNGANRRYTIEMKSIRRFKYSEVYS